MCSSNEKRLTVKKNKMHSISPRAAVFHSLTTAYAAEPKRIMAPRRPCRERGGMSEGDGER